MQYIREYWSRSKTYRILLLLAISYTLLRLAFQVSLYTDVLGPESVTEGAQVSADLQQSYVTAAQRFQARQDLYSESSQQHPETYYIYSPAFAFFFQPVLLLPLPSLLPLTVILHVAAYMLLYIWWSHIFEQNNLFHIGRQWAHLLPLYLVFSVFWDGLAYANMYIVMAMLATFLFDAILNERLGAAAFWLGAVILPIEPHWAFVLLLPLLLRKYRFFLRLLAGAALVYLVVAGIAIMLGGVDYGLRQYQAYFGSLIHIVREYPWRDPAQPFLGYNHSLLQTVFYLLGISSGSTFLVNLLKLGLLLPLAWVGLKFLRRSSQAQNESSGTVLALFFALYLGTLICLDLVWEVSLGIVIFAYLLATSKQNRTHTLLWGLFGPYALLDVWRIFSYLVFGNGILYQEAYVLTDPFIYIPWMMVIILVFYAMLLVQLNKLSRKLP